MATTNYTYWPFPVEFDAPLPGGSEEMDQHAFLKAAHDQGFDSFRFGINDYGARSSEREGCILERGRARWEILLAEGVNRRFQAYVNDFGAAGRAVSNWLRGATAEQLVEALASHLVTPPGARSSYSMK